MSAVRIIVAEVEGSPEMIQQVLGQVVDRFRGSGSSPELPPALPPPPSPVPELPASPVTLRSPELQERPTRRKAAKRPAKFKFKKEALPSRSTPVERSERPLGETDQKLRGLLARGPQTSGELIRLSGLSAPTVYTWLTAGRKSNLIDTRVDEKDGLRKNFLVQ